MYAELTAAERCQYYEEYEAWLDKLNELYNEYLIF